MQISSGIRSRDFTNHLVVRDSIGSFRVVADDEAHRYKGWNSEDDSRDAPLHGRHHRSHTPLPRVMPDRVLAGKATQLGATATEVPISRISAGGLPDGQRAANSARDHQIGVAGRRDRPTIRSGLPVVHRVTD